MNNIWTIYVWFMYYLWIDCEYITVNELWILCIDYVLNMNKLWTNHNRNDSYYLYYVRTLWTVVYLQLYQIHKQFKNPIIFYHLFKLSIQFRICHLRSISCYSVLWSAVQISNKILVSSQIFCLMHRPRVLSSYKNVKK